MMAKLGDIATYINGYAFKPQDWSDEGIPIIRIQDLTGNSYQANRYNGEYASKYEVNDGDVLISWSASLGVYIWHGEKAVLNQHIFKVVFDKERISKDFFVHQVGLILENAASDAHGATMKHLTKPVFDALPFYLPPYEKQCEIAEVLDKVTSLISLRKQQLAKLDELVKARFVEMFGTYPKNENGFPVAVISDVANVSVGVVIKPAQYYVTEECGIKAFRSLNIGEMYIKDSDWVYFSTEGNESNKKSQLHENDLLIVRSGAPGTSCVVTKEFEGCNAVDVIIAHPNLSKVNPWYLCAYINYPHGKKQIEEGTGGAAQQHFNVGKCNNLKVLLPPLEPQNQFAAFVERVNQQKQTVQQSLEKLELMKKALMQEYFG